MGLAFRGKVTGDEAHGFPGQGTHPASQDIRQELMSQTEPQVSPSGGNDLPDHLLQRLEVGKFRLLVHVGGTPQNHQGGKGFKGRQGLMPNLSYGKFYPGFGQGREQMPPRALPGHVLHDEDFFSVNQGALPET
jgi:hypothetical protein